MSFRCEQCGATQGSGVKPHRVVVEKRLLSPKGWEIVKEVDLCDLCSDQKSLDELIAR